MKTAILKTSTALAAATLPFSPLSLPAQQELDPLVVTGTRSERRLSEAAVRTEILNREQLETTQSKTLADALEWSNGVRVENNCQNCNFSQIRLLGLQGGFTQVLTDGRPTLSSLASVYGVEQIPMALVEQIEIVKGGGSALYGPGAIAGVVNIIPREPTENGGYLNYDYSTFGAGPNHLTGLGLDQVNKDGTLGFTTFGQFSSRSPYDHNGDGFTELGMQDLFSAGMRAFWEPTKATRLSVDFTTAQEERRGGDRLDQPVTQAEIAEMIESQLYQGGIRWEHEIDDKLSYELSLSGNYTQRDTYYGSGMDPNAFGESESPVFQADALMHYQLNDETKLSFGMQYQYEKLEDEQPAYNRFTFQEIENFGVISQAEWDPTDKWNIVAGARLDFNSELDDPVISPRVSGKYKLVEDFALRGSYSSGFRAPQVFDEDLAIEQAGGNAQVIRNGANLIEETSQSVALGFEWNPALDGDFLPKNLTAHDSNPITFEVNGFFTRLKDTFDIVEDDDLATPETEFTRINGPDADVYGAELNIVWEVTQNLRFDLGYVEQRSLFDDPSGKFNSKKFDRTPERYGLLGLTWDSPICEVFLGGKFTGPMEVPHYAGFVATDRLEKSPSFFTVDLGLSKIFQIGDTNLTVTAGVKNLFDDYQDDLDEGANRDPSYVYGPRFPRMFHLGCKYEF